MGLDELIKLEDGMQVIDMDESFNIEAMNKYDILGELFYTKSMSVENDPNLGLIKNGTKRYFGGADEQCYNCGEHGHIMWNCPIITKNCFYCSMEHPGKPCPYTFCTNCYNLGHHDRACRERGLVRVICQRCTGQRHFTVDCPLGWRIYKVENTNRKESIVLSCAYCHENDHFIDDCKMKDRKFSIFTVNYKQNITIQCKNEKKKIEGNMKQNDRKGTIQRNVKNTRIDKRKTKKHK